MTDLRHRVARFTEQLSAPTERGCILWMGCKIGRGYGAFSAGGRCYTAHRFAWEVANGPIPDGMWVCHVCDEPACCNVGHLFLGTARENTADMIRKGRDRRRARLTDAQVAEIRMRRSAGESVRELAAEFKVSGPHISNITSGAKRSRVKEGLR